MSKIIEIIISIGIATALCITPDIISDPIDIEPEGFKFANLIPDVKDMFGIEHLEIIDDDAGDYYIFNVDEVSQDQYEDFLNGCKEKGFVESTYETLDKYGGYYGAYTVDGKYWIEIVWDPETDLLNVCVNTAKRYDELIGEK